MVMQPFVDYAVTELELLHNELDHVIDLIYLCNFFLFSSLLPSFFLFIIYYFFLSFNLLNDWFNLLCFALKLEVNETYQTVCKSLGEDPEAFPSEDFFKLFRDFSEHFTKAIEDNERARIAEEKARKKEEEKQRRLELLRQKQEEDKEDKEEEQNQDSLGVLDQFKSSQRGDAAQIVESIRRRQRKLSISQDTVASPREGKSNMAAELASVLGRRNRAVSRVVASSSRPDDALETSKSVRRPSVVPAGLAAILASPRRRNESESPAET